MVRTRVFGMLAVLGATAALLFASAAPASAEAPTEPEGSISSSEVDVRSSDTAQVNCAASTDRTDVRIREAPSIDGAVFDHMEPGVWYDVACDSTPGGEYGGDCGQGFHWLELYIGDSVGYVALMCVDNWVEVDV